jgi:hypothetical protein
VQDSSFGKKYIEDSPFGKTKTAKANTHNSYNDENQSEPE